MAVTAEAPRSSRASPAGAAAPGPSPLGILACAGPLPIEVAEAAVRQGRPVHIVAIDGFASDRVEAFPHERVSLGEVGRILASFARAGVGEIVIAGAMQRPDLTRLKVDWGFVRNLPTVLALTRGGDDSVLRRIVRFFEGHGLTVVGAGDVAPALLAPTGPLGSITPRPEQSAALQRAARLVAALGPFDVGQAVVATADRIVAVEGVRGTDAMLRDLGPDGIGEARGRGAALAKLAKPGQEMRIDLPTIGAETVARVCAAGLAGIGVGAGATIVLEQARVAADADAAGIFVTGFQAADAPAATEVSSDAPSDDRRALAVVGRRAPTPADRRDIAIGRRLVPILRTHGAGRGAIVCREHVLAISGALPLAAFVRAQGRPSSWGRRMLSKSLGVLVVDAEVVGDGEGLAGLDIDLFAAAKTAGLAGIAWLGPIGAGEPRQEAAAWANEARLFLMAAEETP